MHICVGNGVTEAEIRHCARQGAGSLADLQMVLLLRSPS
jgi:bacterioferritin-associated ferredoxin